jgi:hypothetical protein
MFLPGVSLKVKLVGIAVLTLLALSLVGTALEAINLALAEGTQQPQINHEEFVSFAGTREQAEDENVVVSGFLFVCPFH